MTQDRSVNLPVQEGEYPSQQGARGQTPPGLRALIIPAQVGAEAAQKRRALHGRLAGALTYTPGWDAPEDDE